MGLLDRVLSIRLSGVDVAPVWGASYLTDGKPLNLKSGLLPNDTPTLWGGRAAVSVNRITDDKPGSDIGKLSITYQQGDLYERVDDDDIPLLENLRKIELPPPYDEQLKEGLQFELERRATIRLIYGQVSWELGHAFYKSRRLVLANPTFGLGGGAAIVTYPDKGRATAPFATGLMDVTLAGVTIPTPAGDFYANVTGGIRAFAGKVFGIGGEASANLGFRL